MKKYLLMILALLPICVSSQDFRPLVEEGKKWCYQPYMGGIDYSFEMFVSGDTIVDGHSCKKLYITSAYLGNEPSLNLFLYEEGGKVFQKSVQGSEWALL